MGLVVIYIYIYPPRMVVSCPPPKKKKHGRGQPPVWYPDWTTLFVDPTINTIHIPSSVHPCRREKTMHCTWAGSSKSSKASGRQKPLPTFKGSDLIEVQALWWPTFQSVLKPPADFAAKASQSKDLLSCVQRFMLPQERRIQRSSGAIAVSIIWSVGWARTFRRPLHTQSCLGGRSSCSSDQSL